jgi:hypothetical protein
MLAGLLLVGAAFAQTPLDPSSWRSVDVTYTVGFDLQGAADSVCKFTGICDCTMKLHGAGPIVASTATSATFEGVLTYEGTCHDNLKFWIPADGKAFHTLRLSDDRAAIVEWVAHADKANSARVTSDIKAKQQVWLAEMRLVPDASGKGQHSEKETGDAGGLPIATEHALTVVLGR